MDINGLRSFSLGLGRGLSETRAADAPPAIESCGDHRLAAARLASRAGAVSMREQATSAAQIVLAPAIARDAAGHYAWWDAEQQQLLACSQLAARHPQLAPVVVNLPVEATPVSDLAYTSDGVLLVAARGALWMIDTRGRFAPQPVPPAAEPFAAHRLCVLPEGGALVLDVTTGRVARLRGRPDATSGFLPGREADARFEQTEPDADPPRLVLQHTGIPAGERAVSLAAMDESRIALLSVNDNGGARLRLLREGRWSRPLDLATPRFPHSLGWLDAQRLALLTQAVALAPNGDALPARDLGVFVFDAAPLLNVGEGQTPPPLQALGEFHPARERVHGPFVNTQPGAAGPRLFFPRRARRGGIEPAPVVRLSLAARSRRATLSNIPGGRVDSRSDQTVWHRLFAEACVPANTAMLVWLASTLEGGAPVDAADWHPHLLGSVEALPEDVRANLPKDLPRFVWSERASEVPAGASLLGCAARPAEAGLFEVLVQRADRAVRGLRGRHLCVRIELFGEGRVTPELVVLRAYAGRVSYRDRYLSALYREEPGGMAAEVRGRAAPADFLDRYVTLFEGLYTDIENRVANAHLHTDAQACPEDALPWLAGWVGLALEPGLPPLRARWMLANAARLARAHGTLEGLRLSLDIATDGALSRGRVVVVENFRLRRTLATILGAQLADAADPLTAGLSQNRNSIVGDALFLGDESQRERLLTLFRVLDAGHAKTAARQAAARHALFDGLAHRATVLVHDAAGSDELRLISRLAEVAAPAHVELRVVAAPYPLLVSVASLVGADTYLRGEEPIEHVRVNRSRLGTQAQLRGAGTLDPYAEAYGALQDGPGSYARPLADARAERAPPSSETGEPGFLLDGSRSSAASGRRVANYRWTRLPAPPGENP